MLGICQMQLEPACEEESDSVGGVSIAWHTVEQRSRKNGLSGVGQWRRVNMKNQCVILYYMTIYRKIPTLYPRFQIQR